LSISRPGRVHQYAGRHFLAKKVSDQGKCRRYVMGEQRMNLPTQEELQALRKGLRKRKLSRIFDGMWCSEPGIGGVKETAAGSNFHVEWASLCSDPNLEM
jgi:hypothetical protein